MGVPCKDQARQILAGNADEREDGVAASVGQRRPMR
jgi:hypothetical protein